MCHSELAMAFTRAARFTNVSLSNRRVTCVYIYIYIYIQAVCNDDSILHVVCWMASGSNELLLAGIVHFCFEARKESLFSAHAHARPFATPANYHRNLPRPSASRSIFRSLLRFSSPWLYRRFMTFERALTESRQDGTGCPDRWLFMRRY